MSQNGITQPNSHRLVRLLGLIRNDSRAAQLHSADAGLQNVTLVRFKKVTPSVANCLMGASVEFEAIVTTHFELIDCLTSLIRALKRPDRDCRPATAALLATIPAIGPYRSLLLAAELSPLTRFPRVEHLTSYAGLPPVTRSSGGLTRHGSIPQGTAGSVGRSSRRSRATCAPPPTAQ